MRALVANAHQTVPTKPYMEHRYYVRWKLKSVLTHCSSSKVGILFGIFLITAGPDRRVCSPRNQILFSRKFVALFSWVHKQRPGLVTQVFESLFVVTTFRILHFPPLPPNDAPLFSLLKILVYLINCNGTCPYPRISAGIPLSLISRLKNSLIES